MSKKIEKTLRHALIGKGKMSYALYEHEMKELLDEWKLSIAKDNDCYLFSVTENNGDVAMVLIEKAGQVNINEQARDKLKSLWPGAYERNIEQMIPMFAKQLSQGEMPINGIKMTVEA